MSLEAYCSGYFLIFKPDSESLRLLLMLNGLNCSIFKVKMEVLCKASV